MPDPETPHSDKKKPLHPPVAKGNWIDGLVQKSTGIPQDPAKGAQDTSPKGEKTLWSYAGLGIQFAGTIALFTFVGFKLDQTLGSSPWGIVSLAMIAVIGSFYLLVKETFQADKKQERKK